MDELSQEPTYADAWLAIEKVRSQAYADSCGFPLSIRVEAMDRESALELERLFRFRDDKLAGLISQLGHEFHKTRLSGGVVLEPEFVADLLTAAGFYQP